MSGFIGGKMEIWDGYNKDGTKAGIDLVRGEDIPDGIYFMTVEILVRHTDGDYLLMKRDGSKPAFPGFFEATAGGAAQKGETPLEAAKRELAEETGAVAEKFIPLGVVDTTPALIDEKIHLYMAEGLTFGQMHPDEGEFLGVELIPLATLLDMVMSGEIRDGKTQIAILKAARIKGI